jgi:hypothetical protein
VVCSFFFQISRTNPSPNHFFCPPLCLSIFFWALIVLALRGYCSAGLCQIGVDSDRAPCPAPVSCVCHVLLPNISLFFSSPMQAGWQTPADSLLPARFGRSEHLYFLVYPPAHLHDSVCLPVLHASPLCPMLPNASLLFFAISHLTAPILG